MFKKHKNGWVKKRFSYVALKYRWNISHVVFIYCSRPLLPVDFYLVVFEQERAYCKFLLHSNVKDCRTDWVVLQQILMTFYVSPHETRCQFSLSFPWSQKCENILAMFIEEKRLALLSQIHVNWPLGSSNFIIYFFLQMNFMEMLFTLYFKGTLLQCSYTNKYWVILINYYTCTYCRVRVWFRISCLQLCIIYYYY